MKHLIAGQPLPSFKLSRFGDFYGVPISEFVVSNVINYERRYCYYDDAQKQKMWYVNCEKNLQTSPGEECFVGIIFSFEAKNY